MSSFDSLRYGGHRLGADPRIYDLPDAVVINNNNNNSSNNTVRKPPSIVELQNLHMFDNYGYDIPVTSSERGHGHPNKRGSGKARPRKRTKVFITVVILKIGQIETIKEYYEADVFVQSRWREPLLDGMMVDGPDFKPPWTPRLKIQNIFEEPKQTIGYRIRYGPNKEATVYELRRVKGKFEESMELNDFPFDVQSLSLHVTSELTLDAVDIRKDEQEISTIHTECFSDSQEWRLYNFVEMTNKPISAEFSVSKNDYPGIAASCCVSRMSGFFAWNVLVIINFLNIFGFTTFAVDPKLTQNRLQLSFILVLAGISFRFVTNQSIPKISYLTHLDRYVLLSMVFSGSITLWHAVISRFDSHQKDIDFGAFIVFACFYFLFQAIFIVYTLWQKRKKISEIRESERAYNQESQEVRQKRSHNSIVPMQGFEH